jgi:hypothetical protein
VERDRERRSTRPEPTASTAAAPATASSGSGNIADVPRSQVREIAPTRGEEKSIGDAYGTSYTNRKTKEYDLLQDIVKQTRQNFIDVAAREHTGDDITEREDRYNKQLAGLTAFSPSSSGGAAAQLAQSSLLALFPPTAPVAAAASLPKPAETNDDINLLFNDASISAANFTCISHAASQVHDALTAMRAAIVGHNKRLVLSFEEL